MNKSLFRSWAVILLVGAAFCIDGVVCGLDTASVVTKTYTLQKTVYLTPEKNDSLYLDLQYAYPTAISAHDSVLQSIQTQIKTELFGEAFADMRPDHALSAYAALNHTQYIQDNQPLADEWGDKEHGSAFCEELIIRAEPVGVANGILSYAEDIYSYTGGAHGMSICLVKNYSLATGQSVHEEDLFIDDYFEPLCGMLVEALIHQTENVDTERELRKLGYSVEDIVPNDNFFVSEEGITYVYMPYEIAPYALGRTDIFLPWSVLNSILK